MKVRLINFQGDRTRTTSFGTLEFDSEGISIQELDREQAEAIIAVSSTLGILGEPRKIVNPVKRQEPIIEETHPSEKLFSKDELNQELIQQGERLLETVSTVLGLDKEMIIRKMQEGIVSEPCVLVPVSEFEFIASESKGLHIENIETIGEPVGEETPKTEEPVEEVTDSVVTDSEPAGEDTSDTIETKEQTEAKLQGLTIDKLREILIEANISPEKWSHLKGNSAKQNLIELILEEVY